MVPLQKVKKSYIIKKCITKLKHVTSDVTGNRLTCWKIKIIQRCQYLILNLFAQVRDTQW